MACGRHDRVGCFSIARPSAAAPRAPAAASERLLRASARFDCAVRVAPSVAPEPRTVDARHGALGTARLCSFGLVVSSIDLGLGGAAAGCLPSELRCSSFEEQPVLQARPRPLAPSARASSQTAPKAWSEPRLGKHEPRARTWARIGASCPPNRLPRRLASEPEAQIIVRLLALPGKPRNGLALRASGRSWAIAAWSNSRAWRSPPPTCTRHAALRCQDPCEPAPCGLPVGFKRRSMCRGAGGMVSLGAPGMRSPGGDGQAEGGGRFPPRIVGDAARVRDFGATSAFASANCSLCFGPRAPQALGG